MKNSQRVWGDRLTEYLGQDKLDLMEVLADKDVELNSALAERDYYKEMYENLNQTMFENAKIKNVGVTCECGGNCKKSKEN